MMIVSPCCFYCIALYIRVLLFDAGQGLNCAVH